MFDPSQHDVRRFFCGVYRKWRDREPLTPLEGIAADWVAEHPQYHQLLTDESLAIESKFDAASGQGNPFLHLSMHLAIAEQISIDQPPGIRAITERMAASLGSMHAVAHEVMECLGQVLWHAQRSGLPPDGQAYLECLERSSQKR